MPKTESAETTRETFDQKIDAFLENSTDENVKGLVASTLVKYREHLAAAAKAKKLIAALLKAGA